MAEGQRGALPLYSGLLTWNESGLSYSGRTFFAGDVEQVVARSGYIYALTRNQIDIFNSKLARVGVVAAEGVTALTGAGRKLVAATPKGLDIFDLTDPAKPRATSGFAMEGAGALQTPAIGGSAQRVLVHVRDQYAVVDVGSDQPYIAARYLQTPWFAGAAVYGDVTVCPSGTRDIDIFTPGPRSLKRF
jgi:hypothetical protein